MENKRSHSYIFENEAFLKYCTSCKALVCLECIIGAHRQHEFKHIKDIIKQNRTQVEEVFEQIKTKNIPELEQSIVSITQKEETYSQEIKNMIAKMTTRGNHLKQATDTLIDAIKNELMQQATKDKNRLKATKKQIDQNLKTLKTQLSEQEQRVQKFNGIDTIVNAADIMTSLSKVTSFIVEIPSVQPPGFQTGEDNDENLKNMIGQLVLKKSLSEYPLKADDQTRFPADPDVKIRATFNNKTSHNRTRYDQKNWHRFDQEFVDRLPEKDENKNAKLKKDKEKSYRENSIFYDT